MPNLGMFANIIHMDLENHLPVQVKPKAGKCQGNCRLTSEKARYLLAKFPPSKPISSNLPGFGYNAYTCRKCIATNCKVDPYPIPQFPHINLDTETIDGHPGNEPDRIQLLPENNKQSPAWSAVTEVVQLLQLVVTATAFALYYLIYGWMQLVYHGLLIAMYFKNSDGPMKITLGVVAVTSIVVGFNMFLRIRKIYSDVLR